MMPTVALARMLEYESTLLPATVALLMKEAGYEPAVGRRVLVKPNLVSAANAGLSCTHPLVVRAVCTHLLNNGEHVTVADSPAFGPASRVARAAGLDTALKPLGLRVHSLGTPRPTALPCGCTMGISSSALDADIIVNIPRLKAHCQMRVTCAVKNLFGCVTGFRKAVSHNTLGNRGNLFREMVMDLPLALPPVLTVLDGVRPMHEEGPIHGRPFDLGLLGASESPVALDTAIYSLLGLATMDVPLWAEATKRQLPGSDPAAIHFPLEKPQDFDAHGFAIPTELDPIRFEPLRLIRGRLKSLLAFFQKT
ncbi:DUF362 domain-containing protein [Pseudodesulfovibrio senegalensis]|uniref:DUF362 domain-containing protein n=2 Tax=Pseudodesulfovibrio senegalensis TaxID=1721087 RepID=A0A6N6N3G4_9BACT|nr:DUF362 domain-containing protein [Pseudodesulfovibrio senegalensis]